MSRAAQQQRRQEWYSAPGVPSREWQDDYLRRHGIVRDPARTISGATVPAPARITTGGTVLQLVPASARTRDMARSEAIAAAVGASS